MVMDTKEKLVQLIKKASYECDEGTRDLYDMREVADTIADFLIANGVMMQKWVPVTERLPEDSGYYLVVHRNKYNGSISIAFEMYIKCKIGEWWENDYAYDVTHWMLLPEMPKGE